MLNLRRWFASGLSTPMQEFATVPPFPFKAMPSVNTYRDDRFEAIVTQSINPGRTGQVKFKGSWWNARCGQDFTLVEGQVVDVVDRRGNTLYVEPVQPVQRLPERSLGLDHCLDR
ncbi:NfeD family protein [Leptothermofonsia sichuanensis E412]|uniref:NfeD family protein n=1 Tax=Leptothermofonsia sichuanensis TaxID=2917832 RepID=UPI001CA6B3E5|nr:NfeD family protein [Leptothermofonsia sichuanensis]QZZ18561.1 NfeD family protein [Leptothermofonsia sichuanensis E412]